MPGEHDTEREDEGAVAVLVDNHKQFLNFLQKRVGSREDAEEILQTAFVKSLEKGETIREDGSAVAWFYRVLRNALTDHHRRRATGRKALEALASKATDATEDPDPALEQVICGCMKDLIGLLNPDYERILRRVDLEGADVSAVAGEIGITAGNARVRLHRARQALRRELERSCGTCTEHGCLDCTCSAAAEA